MRVRVEVRDGFVVLLAALWCMDGTNVLPLFLLAAAVHEAGHVLTLYLSGGRVHRLVLTCCGAVLRCALPDGRCARAAVCLAGPAASFALTAAAGALGAWRLAGASALLGLVQPAPHAAARRRHDTFSPVWRTLSVRPARRRPVVRGGRAAGGHSAAAGRRWNMAAAHRRAGRRQFPERPCQPCIDGVR